MLVGLCVGANEYKVKGRATLDRLRCSERDAEKMAEILREHRNSALFTGVRIHQFLGKQASAEAIRKEIRDLVAGGLKREDCFVLFLSLQGGIKREPDSFFLVPPDADLDNPRTLLSGKELAADLAQVPCRKVLFIDSAHAGALTANFVSSLKPPGGPLLIFAACTERESAFEPTVGNGDNGLFTEALLASLGGLNQRPRSRTVPVRAGKLIQEIRARVSARLDSLAPGEHQTPQVYPEELSGLPILCRPPE
jgi:hypothetical protein